MMTGDVHLLNLIIRPGHIFWKCIAKS